MSMPWGAPCWFPPQNTDDGHRRQRRARRASTKKVPASTESYNESEKAAKKEGEDLALADVDLENLSSDASVMIDSLGDSRCLVDNTALSNRVVSQLDCGDCATWAAILAWTLPHALELALSAGGCRVIQKL